jgi:uncharacterized protein (DUF697 family)
MKQLFRMLSSQKDRGPNGPLLAEFMSDICRGCVLSAIGNEFIPTVGGAFGPLISHPWAEALLAYFA